MTTPTPNRRCFHPTPDRFFVGLLAVQVFLLLSNRFQWFAFNEKKGWSVLIAIGVVGVAVVVMLVWGLVCFCLRRRFQFNVRSLLVFLVALSVPLGWFTWEMQRARRQREAVEAIWEAGCWVGYDYEVDEDGLSLLLPEATTPSWMQEWFGENVFCEVVAVECDMAFGDDDARNLSRLPNLRWLRLRSTKVSDAGLEHLKELTSLHSLDLCNTHVSDAGLEHIKGLTKLKELDLCNTEVTGDGLRYLNGLSLEILDLCDTQISDSTLEHIKGLTSLKELDLCSTPVKGDGLRYLHGLSLEILDLSDTQISDCTLEHVKGLTKLEDLTLSYTPVTDAGLENLKGLTSLQRLCLYDTQVTSEGVSKLQETLPHCEIQCGLRRPPPPILSFTP